MSFALRHHPNPAREQWERTERWYARLRAAASERESHLEDHALAVFHHCWSMYEWLTKSLRAPTSRAKVENGYTQAEVANLFQSAELRACRLVANAAKHLDLHPKMNAGVYGGTIIRAYHPQDGSRLMLLAAEQYDVLDLCAACMNQIRSFVKAHGWTGAQEPPADPS